MRDYLPAILAVCAYWLGLGLGYRWGKSNATTESGAGE